MRINFSCLASRRFLSSDVFYQTPDKACFQFYDYITIDLTSANGVQGSPKVSLPESSNSLMSFLSTVMVGIEGTDISLPGSFALELLKLHCVAFSLYQFHFPQQLISLFDLDCLW